MANQLYPKGKEGFLGSLIDMDTDDIRAVLCRDTYNAAHEFLSSLTDIVATSPQLTSPTITNGVFDSADLIYPSVGATASTPYLVLYHSTGVAGTSRLIAHIDTATGLPVTPDGTNINVSVNASGWFTL
jgi:hypothetical protein